MSDQTDKGGDGTAAADGAPEPSPADTFKQGMGLLWKAARATVDEIKTEVDKSGVRESLKQASRDVEQAANQAAKTLEEFIDRVGPNETPAEQQGWPGQQGQPGWPGAPEADTPEAGAPEAGAPEAQPDAGDAPAAPKAGSGPHDGNMRIHIDDDAV